MRHYCVISHTHWDREWYLTQEQFRFRLVNLMDRLLVLLKKQPDYIFHLDAQTIVLEDYWEIKPQRREECCRYIREGRLIVGPWYVQNDFFLVSGEATVRNLLLGKKQAADAGGCGDCGYMPDQFGLISQLPQLLRGFGIDYCIFGRGYHDCRIDEQGKVYKEPLPSELIWKSPDGSEVFAVCMSHWYNNTQRFSADPERAMRLVEMQKKQFAPNATTPHLLMMNGVDHLEPQDDLLSILRDLQQRLSEGERIYQTTLRNYVDHVRNHMANQEITCREGELIAGSDEDILKDCASTRIYIKTKNAFLQTMLEMNLEPLHAMLESSGMSGSYPSEYTDYLWKMLIRNHAHDSICGCSKDAVMRHIEDRFACIEETGTELMQAGMELLNAHVSRDGMAQEDYLLTVFNSMECARTQVVEAVVDVLTRDKPTGLQILDPQGREVPYTLLKQYKINKSCLSALNLPGFREVERYHIRFLAETPAFGFTAYIVRTQSAAAVCVQHGGEPVMENESLRVEVTKDGQIDLLHKATGNWLRNVLTMREQGDAGHSYVFAPVSGETPLELSAPVSVAADCLDDLRQSITLSYAWEMPAYLDEQTGKRSAEMVVCPVSVKLTLDRDAKWLDVSVDLDNKAKDHRIQAVIRTGIDSDRTLALSPYDVVWHDKTELDPRICNESRHNSGMVRIADGHMGMTVLNRGLYNYENLQNETGTLTLTLVRSTGMIYPHKAEGAPVDQLWSAPENQCLRPLHLEFALYPHNAALDAAQSVRAARAYQAPLCALCMPVDTKKFAGGRAAVQDTSIDEEFFLPDPYPTVQLPRSYQSMKLEGESVQVTAWKKAFDGTGYILRFFNASDAAQTAKLTPPAGLRVYKSDLQEAAMEPCCMENDAAVIPVRPKEIITLKLL